ncbi:MAG: hypothetical protein ACMXYK_03635 [Candidatus Woesearchaeota archaeon]
MTDYRNVFAVDREIVRSSCDDFIPDQHEKLMSGVHVNLVAAHTGNYLFEGPDFLRDGDGLLKKTGSFTPYLAIDDRFYEAFKHNIYAMMGDAFDEDNLPVVIRSPSTGHQLDLKTVALINSSQFPFLEEEAGSNTHLQQIYDLVQSGKMNWPGF